MRVIAHVRIFITISQEVVFINPFLSTDDWVSNKQGKSSWRLDNKLDMYKEAMKLLFSMKLLDKTKHALKFTLPSKPIHFSFGARRRSE